LPNWPAQLLAALLAARQVLPLCFWQIIIIIKLPN
jgi:hypothetical protein